MVSRAVGGEDVVITVAGVPKVRLTPLEESPRVLTTEEKVAWMRELEQLAAAATVRVTNSSQEIFDELRADRF